MVILTPGFPSSCHGENRPKVRVNTGVFSFMLMKKGKEERAREGHLCRGFHCTPVRVGATLRPYLSPSRETTNQGGDERWCQHDPAFLALAQVVCRVSLPGCLAGCLVPGYVPRYLGRQGGAALSL